MARSREGETKRGTSHAAYAQTFLSFVLSSTPRRPPLANFRITPPPSRGPYAVDVWPEATARPERRSRFYPRRGLTFLDPPPPCQWGCFPLCGFRLDRQFYATDSSLAPLPFTLSVVEVEGSTCFWGIRGMHGVSWKWVRSIGSIDEEEEERGFVDRLLVSKRIGK